MIFMQKWQGCRYDDTELKWFDATVPGSIQFDYSRANYFEDYVYADNFHQFDMLEDYTWAYRTDLVFDRKNGDSVYFVSKGIDYNYEIYLNDIKIYSDEGMFSTIEIDITDKLQANNVLLVVVHKHPKASGTFKGTRDEANQSCKPAVAYGWDWHPRLLNSGIWEETYIETRKEDYINHCEVFYKLSDDLKSAEVSFDIECKAEVSIEFCDMEGNCIYKGIEKNFTVNNLQLWWCNGQGEQYLYNYRVYNGNYEIKGTVGFRKINLVMYEGHWYVPDKFPKSRSVPPITIELNNRVVFAKGTNWLPPEIFPGKIEEQTYEELIILAKEANMNIFRCWGGAIVNKQSFFNLCDKYGIMIWQEFPLACNNYQGTDHYMNILKKEATSIIRRLRSHPSLALWCGGNELLNGWSKMTEQSPALRLLNALTYKYCPSVPFITSSPLMGMAHGPYSFWDDTTDMDVFELFSKSDGTAYTEFGVPSMSPMDVVKKIIPKEELFPIVMTPAWLAHHAFMSWGEFGHLSLHIVRKYFGEPKSLQDIYVYTNWLQCEGYKAIFEASRRQKPYCSMAINWCYNEPWPSAAGNNIICYPTKPKESYYAIKDALRPILASAAINKFVWNANERFHADIWLLNDYYEEVSDCINVYFQIGNKEVWLLEWKTGIVKANENKQGPSISIEIPEEECEFFVLKLISEKGFDSSYKLKYQHRIVKPQYRELNK